MVNFLIKKIIFEAQIQWATLPETKSDSAWRMVVEKLRSFRENLFSGALAVSFREGTPNVAKSFRYQKWRCWTS